MRPSPLAIAAAVLLACVPAGPADARQAVSVCHYTGSASSPYLLLEAPAGGGEHAAHGNDLIPAPEGGCPATFTPPTPTATPTPAPEPEPAEVTLCHATGDGFVELTVRRSGVAEHRRHRDDLIPAPEGGCPAQAPDAPDDEAEEDEERPARSSGGGGGVRPQTAPAFKGLPHTGGEPLLLVLAALSFLSLGAGLRLLVRSEAP